MRSLTLQRAFLAIYAAVAAYCLLSIVAGPAGLIAYAKLEERRDAMQANLEELQATHGALQSELAALTSDPDRLRREARELGYLAKGETAIVLPAAAEPAPRRRFEAGRVLPYAAPPALSDERIKTISLAIGLASLICALVSDLRRSPVDRSYSAPRLGRPKSAIR